MYEYDMLQNMKVSDINLKYYLLLWSLLDGLFFFLADWGKNISLPYHKYIFFHQDMVNYHEAWDFIVLIEHFLGMIIASVIS